MSLLEERQSKSDDAIDSADQICRQLTESMLSLAADASALRQISCIASGIRKEEGNLDDSSIIERLRSLDNAVTAIERKTKALRVFLNEEQKSLQEVENIADQAANQGKALELMIKKLDSQSQRENSTNHVPNGQRNFRQSDRAQGNIQKATLNNNPLMPAVSTGQRHLNPSTSDIDSLGGEEEEEEQFSISFGRITKEEFHSVSRAIRGSIPLVAVREALAEIETIFGEKYASKKPVHGQGGRQSMESDIPTDQPWVSEQELRQSCAFFLRGESSARTILLIIRSLNRLKQMPSKAGQVVYILPTVSRTKGCE